MKIFRILLFAISILTVSSCDNEEFFTLDNPPEDPWLDIEQFERAPIGAYYQVFTGSSWNNMLGGTRLLKVCQSDLVQLLPGTSANIPFNEMYGRMSDLEIDKTFNAFRNSYRVIASCNDALRFIEENNGNPFPELSEDDVKNQVRRIEGELHFLRGYAYWMLSTIFLPPYELGGDNNDRILPYRTKFIPTFEGAKAPEIGSTQQIYDLVVSDFQKAKELLPERFVAGVHHPSYEFGRANRFAASAMLSKVYFMMGKDTEALSELNYVIDQNEGDYNLSEDPIEAFNKADGTRGKEVIWYALYYDPLANTSPSELTSINLQHYVAKNGGNTWPDGFKRVTWNQFTFSYHILEQINWMTDPLNGDYSLTEEALQDKRFQQLYRKLEGYNPDPEADPSKYETVHSQVTTPMVWSDKYYRGVTEGRLTNVPVIRLAEMYLTRSLLRLRAADAAGATSDLNIVRNRAGIGDLEGAITEEAIENERIKELAFEGDRTDYLRSAKVDIPPGDRDISAVPYNDESLVWVIPQAELDLNQGY